MDLRRVDLNLLFVFEALMAERHVTRAARRIGITQPAMSNALSRLRNLMDDPLLVRTATGMEPTRRAQELIEPTRKILHEIQKVLASEGEFDPSVSRQTFSIRMSDLLIYLIGPKLIDRVRRAAPGIQLNVIHLSHHDTVIALENDDIELAVSTGLKCPPTIIEQDVSRDRLVCVLREDHPQRNESMSLETFLMLPHLQVVQNALDIRLIDEVLSGQKRNIVARIPTWISVPVILQQTDLVAVMPERLAQNLLSPNNLTVVPLPVEGVEFYWRIYWHRRHNTQKPHIWLRSTISKTCEEIFGKPNASANEMTPAREHKFRKKRVLS